MGREALHITPDRGECSGSAGVKALSFVGKQKAVLARND